LVRDSYRYRQFGPNTDLPFSIRVGSAVRAFRLTATVADISLSFDTNGNEQVINIEVPRPTSPSEIGVNGDTRKLGILLKEMQTVPLE
jgi:hypothetical protein